VSKTWEYKFLRAKLNPDDGSLIELYSLGTIIKFSFFISFLTLTVVKNLFFKLTPLLLYTSEVYRGELKYSDTLPERTDVQNESC
jgi:hypothetical protein